MAEMDDDAFGGAEFVAAEQEVIATEEAPASQPAGLGFEEASAEEFTPASNGSELNHLDDYGVMEAVQQEEAFLSYTPAASMHPEPVVAAEPAAPDPRIAWRQANSASLLTRDKEESEKKKAVAATASEFLKKAEEDRLARVAAKKKANRESEKKSPEAGVPEGATWDKVNGLINFKQDKTHTKDISCFKECLTSCKALKVPVSTR
ncbi:hypothetical protein FOA52_003654 [Chlamydomonas sp. UWO 241]|nr:hypothetical protein FOA52_003654 [Chlamydomonas sp. UWO 241]